MPASDNPGSAAGGPLITDITDIVDLTGLDGGATGGTKAHKSTKAQDRGIEVLRAGNEGIKGLAFDDGGCSFERFRIHHQPDARFRVNLDPSFNMLLTKWGLNSLDMGSGGPPGMGMGGGNIGGKPSGGLTFERFRYEEKVETDADFSALIDSFFTDPQHRDLTRLCKVSSICNDRSKFSVRKRELNLRCSSLKLFERLEDEELFEDLGGCPPAVGNSGHLRGRIEDMIDYDVNPCPTEGLADEEERDEDEQFRGGGQIPANTVLREVLLMPESELYEVYDLEERREFLFRIFQHMVIGGPVCQWEDNVEQYLKATKALYRDFISSSTDKLRDGEKLKAGEKAKLTSRVWEVLDLGEGGSLFRGGKDGRGHRSNFCYVVVDPDMRYLTVWKYDYVSHWGM